MKEYKCVRIRSLSTQRASTQAGDRERVRPAQVHRKLVYPNWDKTAVRSAMRSALRKPRATPLSMAYDRFTSTLFVSPYQNHELRVRSANKWPKNTVSSICNSGDSSAALPRGQEARESFVHAELRLCFPRRTVIASAKEESRMTRRRKTEIGVFRHNPTEIPRNNRFTNARKTGILYHVLAPVAQLIER